MDEELKINFVKIDQNNIKSLRHMHLMNFGIDYPDHFYNLILIGGLSYGYLAEIDSNYCGEVTMRWEFENKKLSLYILTFSVLEEFRRKGIGNKMMQFVIDSHTDVYKITLHTEFDNVIAQKLYKKLGFNEIEIIPCYYKEKNEDGILMERETKVIIPIKEHALFIKFCQRFGLLDEDDTVLNNNEDTIESTVSNIEDKI